MGWCGITNSIYNIAFARITALIGEPALVYMARSKPRRFWIPFLAFALFAASAWPGWASGAATALAVFILGRLPGTGDIQLVTILGAVLFLVCVLVVSVGGKIASTLEAVFRFKVLVVTFVVFILSLVVSRPEIWTELAVIMLALATCPKVLMSTSSVVGGVILVGPQLLITCLPTTTGIRATVWAI
ncbi:MAG: hypothetical protein QW399_01585 [Sulfolobales archaeon]